MSFFRYYKSIIISILILIASLIPVNSGHKISIEIPHFDKFIHFIMYFIFTAVMLIDIKKNIKKPTRFLIVSVLLSIIVFSGIVEIIQDNFIFGRFGSFFDLAANFLGLLSASVLFYKTTIFSRFDQCC